MVIARESADSFLCRHSRESGNPGPQFPSLALDPRFRGDDGKKGYEFSHAAACVEAAGKNARHLLLQ